MDNKTLAVDALRDRFGQLRTNAAPTASVFEEACRNALGQASWDRLKNTPLAEAGRALAKAADSETKNPYHNAVHAQEAMLSAAALAKEEFKDWPAPLRSQMALRSVVAMAAHDLGHDGALNGNPLAHPGNAMRLETLSAKAAAAALAKAGAAQADIDAVGRAILSTDPQNSAAVFRALESFPKPSSYLAGEQAARLAAVCAAADILPSTLAVHGNLLGKLLSEEWAKASANPELNPMHRPDPALARGVGTHTGRAFFLAGPAGHIDALPSAHSTGLVAERDAQLKAYELLGENAAHGAPAAEKRAAGAKLLAELGPGADLAYMDALAKADPARSAAAKAAESAAGSAAAKIGAKAVGKAIFGAGIALTAYDAAKAAQSSYANAAGGRYKDAAVDALRAGLKAAFGTAAQLGSIAVLPGIGIACAGEAVDFGLTKLKSSPQQSAPPGQPAAGPQAAAQAAPETAAPINKIALEARRSSADPSLRDKPAKPGKSP